VAVVSVDLEGSGGVDPEHAHRVGTP